MPTKKEETPEPKEPAAKPKSKPGEAATRNFELLEDVNHLGGKKKGDKVSCVGEPKGGLRALVHFKQVKALEMWGLG